jgi:hypothetical protein
MEGLLRRDRRARRPCWAAKHGEALVECCIEVKARAQTSTSAALLAPAVKLFEHVHGDLPKAPDLQGIGD